jgi:hypothetical protein
MNRKNLLLLTILAVQLVLVVLAFRPEPKAESATKKFFPGLVKDGITGLIISDDKKSVELFTEDGKWYVDRTEKYPADPEKVTELLDKLTALQSTRLVTRTASSHVRLKVAEQIFNRKLTVLDNDRRMTIFLGTSPSNKTLHVRADGENEVYLVNDFSAWEVQSASASWWRGKYLGLSPDDIKGISLSNNQGSFTLERDADKKWHLAGRQEAVSEEAAKELLAKVANLSVLKYLGREEKKEYGLQQPAASLVIRLQEGGEKTLRIGPENKDEKNHILKWEASPFYVSAAAYVVEPLLEKKAESLPAPEKESKPAVSPESK